MTFSYQDTGRRIREQRYKLHLTQESIAELAGISPAFVGAIERGEKKMSVETLAKLAMCLQTDAEYLLFGRWAICRKEPCTLCSDLMELISHYT